MPPRGAFETRRAHSCCLLKRRTSRPPAPCSLSALCPLSSVASSCPCPPPCLAAPPPLSVRARGAYPHFSHSHPLLSLQSLNLFLLRTQQRTQGNASPAAVIKRMCRLQDACLGGLSQKRLFVCFGWGKQDRRRRRTAAKGKGPRRRDGGMFDVI